jgi:hypothetical protein
MSRSKASTPVKPGRRRTSTFVIPNDVLTTINVLASLKGQDNSSLVVEAVQDYIKKPENKAVMQAALTALIA